MCTQVQIQTSSVVLQTFPLLLPLPASRRPLVSCWCYIDFSIKLTLDSDRLKISPLAAPSSNGNGEFGDWNAFSASPSALSNSGPSQPVKDLFGGAQSPPPSNPDPVSPSAELFDLMGGVNHQLTNQHATLSASQSLTFSLGGAAPGASVAMPAVPLSRSQQVGFL